MKGTYLILGESLTRSQPVFPCLLHLIGHGGLHMVIEIDGVALHLAHPDELSVTWVGQEEVMRQLLAAWLVVDAQDLPMNPRLLGKPGVGKTTLAYAAAKRLGRE